MGRTSPLSKRLLFWDLLVSISLFPKRPISISGCRLRCCRTDFGRVSFAKPHGELFNQVEGNRDNKNRNRGCGQHSYNDHRAKDAPRCCTSARRDPKGRGSENESERRHKNRPQAQTRALKCCINQLATFLELSFGKFDYQNRVLRG